MKHEKLAVPFVFATRSIRRGRVVRITLRAELDGPPGSVGGSIVMTAD